MLKVPLIKVQKKHDQAETTNRVINANNVNVTVTENRLVIWLATEPLTWLRGYDKLKFGETRRPLAAKKEKNNC